MAFENNQLRSLILPNRVVVRIQRDMSEAHVKVVLQHELMILARIHGPENLDVIEDPSTVGIFIGTPEEIRARTEEEQSAVEEGRIATILHKHTLHPMQQLPKPDPSGNRPWVPAPIVVEEEIGRLERVYGRDAEEQNKSVVDVVFQVPRSNPTSFIEAAGGSVQVKRKPKAPQANAA